MSNSAARIAEIRSALNSTGKSVSAYSAKFSSGEAPEQTASKAAAPAAEKAAPATALGDDEIQRFLEELSALTKDLKGRSVGRNADDVATLHAGLLRLTATWAVARTSGERAAVEKALAELKGAATGPSVTSADLKEAQMRAAAADKNADALKAQLEASQASLAEVSERLATAEASLAVVQEAAATMDAAADVEGEPVSPLPAKAAPEAVPAVTLALSGAPALGGTLRITGAAVLPAATFQWLRIKKSGEQDPIGGATRPQYAPDPRDMGSVVACAVTPAPGADAVVVATPGPLGEMEGLSATVAGYAERDSAEFNCVIVQRNGEQQDRREVHQLEVLADRVKLKRAGKTRFKEAYGEGMQVCGARGGGDAAAQGLFLALSPSLVFMLACESAKQRNAAILLIRERAQERGYHVLGPKDKADD